MKKTLVLLSLVLAIALSVLSGTLAVYTTTITNLADGNVVAKEFILLENDDYDTFKKNVKIAPTETVEWTFSVKNYNGNIVSETAMDLTFTVDIAASTGKEAIDPLIVTIKKGDTVVEGTKTETGSIIFTDEFPLNEVGQAYSQAHTYTVIIYWPSNDTIDINYAGSGFGTTISVSVTGTQQVS
jgi:plastocyanin